MMSAEKEFENTGTDDSRGDGTVHHYKNRPKYSVCIPNYNMGDTLERALVSVLEQLTDEYEVLVLDDGSTDNSLSVLGDLQNRYSTLRVLPMARDKKRKLGETRNITIREALGEYVILHIDADDVWEPHIRDFVNLFHRLETALGRDVLLSGQQINIARRSFLLEHGPYRNTHRAQDRDMWLRLAAIDAYIPMDHVVFRTRLSRPRKISRYKAMRDSWYHMMYDLRRGTALPKYIWGCLTGLFWNRTGNFSFKMRIFRFLTILPAYIISRFEEPLPPPENMQSHEAFVEYRERVRGTWPELMKRAGDSGDLSFLNDVAARVFANTPDVPYEHVR